MTLDVIDALARRSPPSAGVELQTRIADAARRMITGDRDQIVQVAQNLIDNALKFSAPGGTVEIDVVDDVTAEAAPKTTRAGAARLSLLSPDSGRRRALRAAALRRPRQRGSRASTCRAFPSGYRVEGQKSGERLGTGLGSAIVKHIINRHRGGLAIESVEGRGRLSRPTFRGCNQKLSQNRRIATAIGEATSLVALRLSRASLHRGNETR